MHSVVAAGILAVLFAGELLACQRSRAPQTVAAADADAIAVAIPFRTAYSPGMRFEADLAIERVLKGSLPEKSIAVHRRWFCGEERLDPGVRILAYLRRHGDTYELMLDGTAPHSEAGERALAQTIARLPRWTLQRNGIVLQALPTAFSIAANEELQVVLLYRNEGPKPWRLRYRDWPRETAAWWRADVTREGGNVAAKPHPHVTPQEIENFFSRHGHSFELELQPGESFFFWLGPLNRADPGMGYRERLDFLYYPMTKPGRYTVTIRGRGLTGGEETSAPFTVDVTASAARSSP